MKKTDWDYSTERLEVKEWHGFSSSDSSLQDLASIVASILTPAVTTSLPPGWQGGYSKQRAAEWIAERDDSLDISWINDEAEAQNGKLPDPALLAVKAMEELEGAITELRGFLEELGEEVEV